jgi:hypothetical protein
MQTATTQLTPLVNPSRAARRAEKQAEFAARQARLAALKQQRAQQNPVKTALVQAGLVQDQAPKPAKATKEYANLHRDAKFVLVLNLPRSLLPKNIRPVPLSGGNSGSNKQGEAPVGTRFDGVKVNLTSLIDRMSVDSVKVFERNGFCHAYVEFVVDSSGKTGFNHWVGPYEHFVRDALFHSWDRGILKTHLDGNTSLILRHRSKNDPKVVLWFAIGQH